MALVCYGNMFGSSEVSANNVSATESSVVYSSLLPLSSGVVEKPEEFSCLENHDVSVGTWQKSNLEEKKN